LLHDSDNNIWVGTDRGLCLINRSNRNLKRFSVKRDFFSDTSLVTYPVLSVRVIFEDKAGNIYIGMQTDGLFQFQKTDSSFKKMDIQGVFNIHTIFQDSKNNLWMGTNSDLLLIDDFSNSEYTRYNSQNGLPSDCIYGILEDEDNNLWISTSAGLVKFINAVNNPHSTDFVIYEQSDGLQSNQFFQGAALKSEDGHMLFGGINGFNSFNPDSLKENDFIPPVHVNKFLIFNEPVQAGIPGSPLENVIEHTREIKLSWKQSVFSFGFIALSFAFPEKNRYAYKMEGFDQKWYFTDAGNRLATYTNLDPGSYTFHVKASNNDEKWNEQGTFVRVVILPPFWQTWWFRLGMIGTVAMLIYGGLRIKLRSDRNKRRTLEGMVKKRTIQLEKLNKELEAFAYSVSHDLRTPLRSIDGFSHILLDEYENYIDESGRDYLSRIRNATQKMDNLITDMLNLSRISRAPMKKRKVDLSNMVLQIAGELQEAESGRIVKFKIQDGIIVNADDRLIRIALDNLLGNAWKFTSKQDQANIEFGRFEQNGKPVYFVRDDGAGFEMKYANKLFGAFQRLHPSQEYSGTGIGLATVQRIIYRHDGIVWAKGEVDKGATFYFSIP
jgi:signal transduction histidine kinase